MFIHSTYVLSNRKFKDYITENTLKKSSLLVSYDNDDNNNINDNNRYI